MYGRPIAIAAAAALLLSSPVLAEPAPAKGEQAKPASGAVQPTVFAEASGIKLPAVLKDESAPAKPRRNARVTTCRCADVSPQN
jgi:hypothetical protein